MDSSLPTSRPLAPDFTLRDSRGNPFALSDHLAPSGIVLIFYRGHWCPYCRRYLSKLQSHFPRFTARNVHIAAISPEPPATSRALAEQLFLSFPLLSDPAGSMIAAYGVRNGFTSPTVLLPHPGVFILDCHGRIAFRSIDRNYKKRTTMRRIFVTLEKAGV